VAKKHTDWPLTAYRRTPKRHKVVMTNCNEKPDHKMRLLSKDLSNSFQCTPEKMACQSFCSRVKVFAKPVNHTHTLTARVP
jgi:hypothetical protein